MRAHEFSEQRSFASRIGALLTWLGGGHSRELGERYERSMHAVSGAVVVFGAVLAWLVATLAVRSSVPTSTSIWAIVALTLVFGLLVGAVTRGIASGPAWGWSGIAGRAAVAVAVGVVVGDLAALVVFSGLSTTGSMNEHFAPRIRHRRWLRPRPRCNSPGQHAPRSTRRSTAHAGTWTTRWWSPAANTTPPRPARRPVSPVFRARARGPNGQRAACRRTARAG